MLKTMRAKMFDFCFTNIIILLFIYLVNLTNCNVLVNALKNMKLTIKLNVISPHVLSRVQRTLKTKLFKSSETFCSIVMNPSCESLTNY